MAAGVILANVKGVAGSRVRVEKTPTGWHFASAKGLHARVNGFRDGVACRVAPGKDRDVVQLGIGPATSLLCNALYSPSRDEALVFRGDGLSLEPVLDRGKGRGFEVSCAGPLTVTVLRDFMRVHRGLPWYREMDRRVFAAPPSGWCSWYYYYLKIDEAEVVKNTDWLAANLKKFGCEYVQIDDGWQGRGEGYGSNRDWFVTCAAKFPRGMKWCADYIRSKGFRPGIWCIPFTESNEEMFRKTPSLFVHRADGSSPGERQVPLSYDWMPQDDRRFEWAGRYFIDPTGREGERFLRRLATMLCEDWGYEYVKIDAQGMMSGFFDEHRTRLADPSLDGDRAYRRGLDIFKGVMGRERFLLNCGMGLASIGQCEGNRIGADVGLDWNGIMNAANCTMQWLFMNTYAFYTDPDVVCVREPLPENQARLWATLLGITGQLLMASDKMYELPEGRVELLRRIFPALLTRPMELYSLDQAKKPPIFDLKVANPRVGSWDVVAVFNWNEKDALQVELSPARLGLRGEKWLCLDVWEGRLIHAGDGSLRLELPPASCRVVSYWPDPGRPALVGTSRHITQGACDLERCDWDEKGLALSGTSQVVGGDPYRVRIHVPGGWKAARAGLKSGGRLAEDQALLRTGHGGLVELVIERPENARVEWQVRFERT